MNRYIICLVILFLIKSNDILAQSSIGFGVDGVQHEDTLYIGDTIHFNFWLINQGNVSVNDSIYMSCETFDQSNGIFISSMSIGDPYNTNGSINPGDSIYITISEVVTYQSYVLGDNIIVIWPASNIPVTVDTSLTEIHILDSLLNADLELNRLINSLVVFPDPVSEKLYCYTENNLFVSSISLYDSFGRNIFRKNNIFIKDFKFHTKGLNKGVYFFTVIYNGNKVVRKVFVH
tara:strand:+ start:238 stop:936 length:699 start_codon:yes stop_codon:yes gene_type:complete